ncbi:DUF2662 domain-containing protein [Actinobacteria bacterium YIM 96077]|uniref:DUF2662 domain-containing protein n=1 Tax=Phytoactinopolyspora halophila TaxID=1981511 RepID=A0A329QR90_9ACTN|nr:DUF3662 and FHA domain-containing protein [Phytoactinopolyspora halophila]AYY11384.1 DUF2662 domain-containing protein [Actinobacteria bacterium YIM 96077]RAW14666.1 DUF2662 domain-containing protein [Phytoactinopolyspora halophila]
MGVLQRFERRLESLVQGAFTRAFRSEVQPVEIAAAIQRELDNNAQIVSRQRSLVPNTFTVELGPSDHDRLAPYSDTLVQELTDLAKEHADLQHYAFTGPIAISFERHEDLSTGQFRIRSQVRAGVDRADSYAPPQANQSASAGYLVINGTQHPIMAPGLVLGRGSECDIRIDDPGISRRHVEIRVYQHGHDTQLLAVDLGSTNGTVIDGARVPQAPVTEGSTITLGSTVVYVHQGR